MRFVRLVPAPNATFVSSRVRRSFGPAILAGNLAQITASVLQGAGRELIPFAGGLGVSEMSIAPLLRCGNIHSLFPVKALPAEVLWAPELVTQKGKCKI